jgi:hypothetical protein
MSSVSAAGKDIQVRDVTCVLLDILEIQKEREDVVHRVRSVSAMIILIQMLSETVTDLQENV